MSNGSPNIAQVIFRDIFGRGKSSAVTSRKNEIILKFVKVDILEMEDVLFHLNSSVMMPENPKGKDANDGNMPANDESLDVTGIKALAISFKQFEFDPNKKLIITGHTDTSGTAKSNFELSDERAKNVLYLLNGEKYKWANNCYNRQRVEDYQQIMKYFEPKLNCGCDPGKIDNVYGEKTSKATQNFLKKVRPDQADEIYEKIKKDDKHRWPFEAWMSVYDLYDKEMADALEMTQSELNIYKTSFLSFVDDKKKYVGCGESFPIEQKDRNNYRSQKNRRVELLFFDRDEVPVINCPAEVDTVHKAEDCPLWKKYYFVPLYIDPKDLKSVIYHFKFLYFDRIKNKQLPVPEGLSFKAFEDGDKELPVETIYKKDIFYVKVQFGKKIKDPARQKLYFNFETKDQWIYTPDKNSDPVIVTKSKADYDKLTFQEKQKYYDLPEKWSSRNYWTRYDGDINKGDKYEEVFKTKKKLKPFGDALTKPDAPLTFSLDDTVLTDTNKSQVLHDQDAHGGSITLDENSRVTIFYVDYETKEKSGGKQKNLKRLKIYKPEEAQPVFTNFKFKNNLLPDVPGYSRVIYFCNHFYDIDNKRTSSADNSFNFDSGHIEGARAAIKNDPDVHAAKLVIATNASDLASAYAEDGCGHYELHYLHNCAELDGKVLHYLLIYWSCRFTLLPAPGGGSQADITNHRKFGMVHAMKRINKNYMIEKDKGSEDVLIRPFAFMEAKNDTNGGIHKAMVDVVGNSHGAWMMVNTAQFRKRDYQPDPTYFGAHDKINKMKDTDGSTYAVLTNAHEMGHATGNWDSYLYDYQDAAKTNWDGLPRYNQPFTAIGGPYRCDELVRMYHNRTPRLRNFWKYVLWINDETGSGKALNKFTNGTTFKITFQGTSHKHEFTLADKYKNVEKASHTALDHVTSANSKADLLLYKLGDDELSRLLKSGQVFNGLLVVRIRLAIKFIDVGTDHWGNSKLAWAQQLNNDFDKMLNKKFKISTSTKNDFKNLYIIFTPSYRVYTGAAPANSQINIEASFQLGKNFSFAGNTARVDWDTNNKSIIRFCLGKTTGNSDLSKNDFPAIKSWVESAAVGNAAYNINNL